ncbi:MAG TPA: glycosyl transferase family 1 [Cytophagales bacterium]|nr:glycosyl transferase family 1 [Cytophagales bacterium]HAA17434.1 glycosyl transferase family 1 [Cytophagales bacterium]HAP59006.1 glycosyl transferase family 1 [Cytophagales bacterium]
MKKVLIVLYYWPPSGGSGVQRWLKFVKYLPSLGIEPHVLVPSGVMYSQMDESLYQDIPESVRILEVPIWEPYDWYQRVTGVEKKQAKKESFVQEANTRGLKNKLAFWVRSNVFIPDARTFWVRPAARALVQHARDEGIDTIISTGPPHSCHLVALRAKRKLPTLKWLADFRDPWTNIDFYNNLNLSAWADRRHRNLERKVLSTCDKVVCIGDTMGKEFSEMGAQSVTVIPNGFDADDFPKQEVAQDEGVVITHLGVMGKFRNPEALWRVLARLKTEAPEIYNRTRVRLVGSVHDAVLGAAKRQGIADRLEVLPHLPHAEVYRYLKRSAILLVVINHAPNAKGIITGKVFEYMASGRPILELGPPDGDLAKILEPIAGATVIDHQDEEKLLKYLMEFESPGTQVDNTVERYSRFRLTQQLVEVIEQLG